jgi:hypothetical protein
MRKSALLGLLVVIALPGKSATKKPKPKAGTVSFVQVNGDCQHGTLTTISYPYTKAQTAGNLNVVAIGWNDNTATVASVTDTSGNAYILAVGPARISGSGAAPNGSLSQSIYYAKNIAAAAPGANTVTVKFAGTGALIPDLVVVEYSGADPTSPLDVARSGTGASNPSNSGLATTTNATDLLFASNMVFTGTAGPGSGYTSRGMTSCGDISQDKMVSSTGRYNSTAPLTSTGNWVMQLAAFKAGSAAPPPAGNLTLGVGFGAVALGTTGAEILNLVQNGPSNSTVHVSSVTYSDPAFTTASPILPIDIPAGSALTLQIAFAPTVVQPYSSTVTVNSNAANGPSQTFVATGTGTGTPPPVSHAVSLSWNTSTVPVSGYNIYRGPKAGGPYAKINGSPLAGTACLDKQVQNGVGYYYVTTAVNGNGTESGYSNEILMSIPALAGLKFAGKASPDCRTVVRTYGNLVWIAIVVLVLAAVLYWLRRNLIAFFVGPRKWSWPYGRK